MRKVLLTALALFIFSLIFCQDDITVKKLQSEINRAVNKSLTDTDTLPWIWVKGGTVDLNGTQGSLQELGSGW